MEEFIEDLNKYIVSSFNITADVNKFLNLDYKLILSNISDTVTYFNNEKYRLMLIKVAKYFYISNNYTDVDIEDYNSLIFLLYIIKLKCVLYLFENKNMPELMTEFIKFNQYNIENSFDMKNFKFNKERIDLIVLINIINLEEELIQIPNFLHSGKYKNKLVELYSNIDTKLVYKNILKSIKNKAYVNYYNYIESRLYSKVSNVKSILNPIDKIYRNCNIVKKEHCDQECDISNTGIMFFPKIECKNNLDLKNMIIDSIVNFSKIELILFSISYFQLDDYDLFIKFDYTEYTRDDLYKICIKLIRSNLNNTYPLEYYYHIRNKLKLSDIVLLIISFIINNKLNEKIDFFRYKNYVQQFLIIDDPIFTKNDVFFMILYLLNYKKRNVTQLISFLKLDPQFLTEDENKLYTKYKYILNNVKIDKLKKLIKKNNFIQENIPITSDNDENYMIEFIENMNNIKYYTELSQFVYLQSYYIESDHIMLENTFSYEYLDIKYIYIMTDDKSRLNNYLTIQKISKSIKNIYDFFSGKLNMRNYVVPSVLEISNTIYLALNNYDYILESILLNKKVIPVKKINYKIVNEIVDNNLFEEYDKVINDFSPYNKKENLEPMYPSIRYLINNYYDDYDYYFYHKNKNTTLLDVIYNTDRKINEEQLNYYFVIISLTNNIEYKYTMDQIINYINDEKKYISMRKSIENFIIDHKKIVEQLDVKYKKSKISKNINEIDLVSNNIEEFQKIIKKYNLSIYENIKNDPEAILDVIKIFDNLPVINYINKKINLYYDYLIKNPNIGYKEPEKEKEKSKESDKNKDKENKKDFDEKNKKIMEELNKPEPPKNEPKKNEPKKNEPKKEPKKPKFKKKDENLEIINDLENLIGDYSSKKTTSPKKTRTTLTSEYYPIDYDISDEEKNVVPNNLLWCWMSTFIYTFYYLDKFKSMIDSDTELEPGSFIINLKDVFMKIRSKNDKETLDSFFKFYKYITDVISNLEFNEMNDIDELYYSFIELIPEKYQNLFKIEFEYNHVTEDNEVIPDYYVGYELFFNMVNENLYIEAPPAILKIKYQPGNRIYSGTNNFTIGDITYVAKSLILFNQNHYYCIVSEGKNHYKYDGLNSKVIKIDDNLYNKIILSGRDNAAEVVSIYYEQMDPNKNQNILADIKKKEKPKFNKKKN